MLVAGSAVALLILVDLHAVFMLVTVLLFFCAFLTMLPLFTAVKRQDVFFGGAT